MHVSHHHVVSFNLSLGKKVGLLTRRRSIDILASRIARVTNSHPSSSTQAASRNVFRRTHGGGDAKLCSINLTKLKASGTGHHVSSSQERIIDGGRDDDMGVKSTAITMNCKGKKLSVRSDEGIISKTVDFEVHESAV